VPVIDEEGSKGWEEQAGASNDEWKKFLVGMVMDCNTEGYQPSPNMSPADPSLHSQFQQVIRLLLYIMLGTCSDITFAVTKLSQHTTNPSEDHLSRALYICRYLLGTSDYALVYDGPSDSGLEAYANSDWALDLNTRKSITGYLMKLAGGIFAWNSHAQKTVALLSTEAEYMLLSDTS
jgi:hypothetical protein